MTSHSSEIRAKEAILQVQEKVQEGRRGFFKLMGLGAAATSVGGGALYSKAANAQGPPFASAFALAPNRLYMDIGTTGSTPMSVLRNLTANNAMIARDPSVTFDTQEMRSIVAPGFGAHPFELALSYNATDGMGIIFNGIEAAPGDEIISTNMESSGGNSAMSILADRSGVVIRRVNLPTNDAYSDQEVLNRFAALRNGKTKFIMFSSPSSLSGIRLPEKALSLWAAQNGLTSIIDGAQGTGMLNLNFHDMGVDFYAGSGHKWQCGPGGTGILYVRNQNGSNAFPLPKFWPTFGGYSTTPGATLNGGVRDPNDDVAGVLMSRGHPNFPMLRALTECCQLWDNWRRQNIEDYIVALAQYLRSRIANIWGNQSLATRYDPSPLTHHARVALTSFNPFSPGYDYNAPLTAQQSTEQSQLSAAAVIALRDRNIAIQNASVPHTLRGNPSQSAGPGTYSSPLRISTHLFHSTTDVDRLINALLLTVPHP